MKIYIVKGFGGHWADSWETRVKAVKTEERAKELVKEYQVDSDNYHNEMMWYKDNPDEIPEHFNDMGFFVCSDECKACEVEDYHPDDHYASFTYESVRVED